MSATVVSGAVTNDLRGHRHSLGLAIGVAADEAFLAMAMAPSRFPDALTMRRERRAGRRAADVLVSRLDH